MNLKRRTRDLDRNKEILYIKLTSDLHWSGSADKDTTFNHQDITTDQDITAYKSGYNS